MRIRRLEISAFRRFRDTVVLDGFGDGVTLVVGDNEEGKSTVLAALQTVLFEKHSVGGAVAEAMLPYGSKVRPEIKLEFEHDGERYALHKGFCQKPSADLRAGSGGRWTDDAAEEKLREMLEFTPPGKGGTKAEHRGLQALFWVEQGSAFGQPHINESSQSSLAGALESEVGTVTGGDRGRMLLRRIEERLNRYFTPRTRRPAGDYSKAVAGAAALSQKRDELAGKLRAFENDVDMLDRERRLLTALEADDPVGAADARLAQAQRDVRQVEGLENELKIAKAKLDGGGSQHKLATTRLEQRLGARRAATESVAKVAELEAKIEAAKTTQAEAQRNFTGADEAHRTANATLEAAAREARVARRLADYLEKSGGLVAARDALNKADAADKAAADLEAKVKASSLTPETIDELRRLDEDARGKAALLKGAATLVELVPREGRSASVKGTRIEADSVTLAAPTEIDLDGYGTIRVTPGGRDLASRQKAANDAASKLRIALEKHGATDIQNAVRLGADRDGWIQAQAICRATARAHAPKGLDVLRADVAKLVAEVERLRVEPSEEQMPALSTVEAAGLADEAVRTQNEAGVNERNASDARKDSGMLLDAARGAVSTLETLRDAERKTADSLQAGLEAGVRETSDQQLQLDVEAAVTAQQGAAAEVERLQAALAEGDPDGARAALKAATEARGRVEKNLADKRQIVRDLVTRLHALGNDDLAAELEEVEGKLARAEILESRLEQEAAALELLHTTLAEAERSAREAFLAPVRLRMAPYLKRLLPDSELMLNDQSLEITHLRRAGQDEPYERLSIGTREQLAVLARLAFADLLDEHGKKSPIILDDALVFSDDGRFKKMQDILDRAAERLQIIVLTCHERAYFHRGWTTKKLQQSGPASIGHSSAA